MVGRRDWVAAVLLSLGVAGATVLPYLAAAQMAPPGSTFAGFLINPIDGFTYLAKMRQGAEGAWLLRLPYASQPGPGAFLYVYHLLLGHLARWSGLPLLTVYHAARVLAAFAMFLSAFAFYGVCLRRRRSRWIAFLLTLFGSGFGWLLIPTGTLSADLWIPEAIPFLSAYVNAHFPLAAAAMLTGMAAVLAAALCWRGATRWSLIGCALVCGVVIGAVQPFAMLSLAAALGLWLAWEAGRAVRRGRAPGRIVKNALPAAAALIAGAAPWILYDAWLSRAHPVLRGWSEQNQTPSPPPLLFAAGYGLVLILALVWLVRGRATTRPSARLLVVWLVAGGLLLYAPFSLQRRLSLGLFFPMAALAAQALESLGGGRAARGLVAVALVFSVPSNLAVIGAGLSGVRQQDPSLLVADGEAAAYAWLAEHAPAGSVVLASPQSGNRLPAYAAVHVLYGHPFETPKAEARWSEVRRLYSWQGPAAEGLALLEAEGVGFVLYGSAERALGSPTWLAGLPIVYSREGVEIYGPVSP